MENNITLKINNIDLRIPGLRRSYTFLHISDTHIAAASPDCTPEEAAMAQQRTHFWTPASGILPETSMQALLDYAEQIAADSVFLTGDALDYASDCNIKKIEELCGSVKVRTVFAYGNHEGDIDGKTFYPRYKNLMGDTPGFQVYDLEDLLIVSVDDSNGKISHEQLKAMEEQMRRNLPILLLLHIPVMTEAIAPEVMSGWGPEFMIGKPEDTEDTRNFCHMISAPHSSVAAIFAGHVHFTHQGEFAPGRMQYTAAPGFTGYGNKISVL